MRKAVISDMYETLVTLYAGPVYFGTQIAQDIGVPVADFRSEWDSRKKERSTGKVSLRK